MSINSASNSITFLASQAEASAIREILKLVQKPEVISLAGGLPDPATFPAEEIRGIVNNILSNNSAQVLQYGTTEGLPGLRKSILEFLSTDGIERKFRKYYYYLRFPTGIGFSG